MRVCRPIQTVSCTLHPERLWNRDFPKPTPESPLRALKRWPAVPNITLNDLL